MHLIGTRTRDLPACSIVFQPTTLQRAPMIFVIISIIILIIIIIISVQFF
jgi:hypothetical protein